mgnify:CR=1 FL=1
MSALKPVFRELKQAVLTGFAGAKDKLHHLADNMNDHLDNVAHQVRGIDKFDAPGGSTPGPSNVHYRPTLSGKPPGMSDQNYLDLLESSVHNPNGLEAILGKFRVPGTASYIDVVELDMLKDYVIKNYQQILSWRLLPTSKNQSTPVLLHTYDVPMPRPAPALAYAAGSLGTLLDGIETQVVNDLVTCASKEVA